SADLEGHLALADRDDSVALFNELLKLQGGTAGGGVVFDFRVEGVLAVQRAVAVDQPGDVVGQARQDHVVVGTPKPFDVRLDHLLAGGANGHDPPLLLARTSSILTALPWRQASNEAMP